MGPGVLQAAKGIADTAAMYFKKSRRSTPYRLVRFMSWKMLVRFGNASN